MSTTPTPVTGSVTDANGAEASLNGAPLTLDTDGAFDVTIPLVAGSNLITVVATDPVGNQAVEVRTVVYDVGAPVLTVTSPEDGSITGDFKDAFGNRFTVLAAANPEKGSNELNPRSKDHPEVVAQKKGSGYGLLVAQPGRKRVKFEMWRYDFDAEAPRAKDQFEGFPVSLEMGR